MQRSNRAQRRFAAYLTRQPPTPTMLDPRIAYEGFLTHLRDGVAPPGPGLRFLFSSGMYTVTYDHGPSFVQISSFGPSAGMALDALCNKAHLYLQQGHVHG